MQYMLYSFLQVSSDFLGGIVLCKRFYLHRIRTISFFFFLGVDLSQKLENLLLHTHVPGLARGGPLVLELSSHSACRDI